MSLNRIEGAVELLLSLRNSKSQISRLPVELRPSSASEAYAMQAEMTRKSGELVAGWKVGFVPEVRLTSAPIYKSAIYRNSSTIAATEFLDLRVEGEVAFVLKEDLPSRDRPYSEHEVVDAIGDAYAAIEVLSSRTSEFMQLPEGEKIADNMGNGAMIYGPPCVEWKDLDLATLPAAMRINGKVVAEAKGGNAAGNPLKAMTALANHAAGHQGLRSGQIVITGTCTGIHPASVGDEILVRFAGLGEVELIIR